MEHIMAVFATIASIAAFVGVRCILARLGYIKTNIDKRKYYTLRYTINGFQLCGGFTSAITEVTDRYYLRKEPFDVEVVAENILSADGSQHNARAIVKVYLPEENVIAAAEKYFGRYFKHNCDEEIDKELALYMSEGLEKVLEKYNGTEAPGELEKMLISEIYMPALIAHHTVISVVDIKIV